MSQPKILSQWNEASAFDRATDKWLCHLGALSEAVCAGHECSEGAAQGSRGPSALGSAKYAQQHPRTAPAPALPPKEPWLHDLEMSPAGIPTAWLTLLRNQGKSFS